MQNRTKVEIPYGNQWKEVTLPTKNVQIIYPNTVTPQDEGKILLDAIINPMDSPTFDTFLKKDHPLLILVNDRTRPTPTAKVLDILYSRLKEKKCTFLVATGSHRAPTEEEYKTIFGAHYDEFRDRIHFHDAKKDEEMVCLGRTKKGTEIYINKLCVEHTHILVIGSVEPHYFAGWTGGRKAFFPGVAAFKTIEQNHRFALDPQAQTLALKGNPIHEDALEALKTLAHKNIFSIQLILDASHRIYAAVAGNIHSSFLKAVDKAAEVFIVEIQEKVDIVAAIQRAPMDINFYQSQKSVLNGIHALKRGGILLLISKCWDGIGLGGYLELLAPGTPPKSVLERIKGEKYRLGDHKAVKYAEIARWASMWGVCDGVPDTVLKRAFIKPYHDLQSLFEEAIREKGVDAKILILMDGGITVPTFCKTE